MAGQLREELNAIMEVKYLTPTFPRDGSKRKAPIQESGITPRIGTGTPPSSFKREGGSTKSLGSVQVVETAGDGLTAYSGASASLERGKVALSAAVGGLWVCG